jgi:hypothetical protein
MTTQATLETKVHGALNKSGTPTPASRRRRVAWILVLIVDLSFVAWGGMAAMAPDHLLGPGGVPIVSAEYQGFTGLSWSELVRTSPLTAAFMTVIFRVYGAYNVAFGLLGIFVTVTAFRRGERWAWWAVLVGNTITLVSAMIYDLTMRAVGPFEMTEYLGLAMVWGALVVTAPFLASRR